MPTCTSYIREGCSRAHQTWISQIVQLSDKFRTTSVTLLTNQFYRFWWALLYEIFTRGILLWANCNLTIINLWWTSIKNHFSTFMFIMLSGKICKWNALFPVLFVNYNQYFNIFNNNNWKRNLFTRLSLDWFPNMSLSDKDYWLGWSRIFRDTREMGVKGDWHWLLHSSQQLHPICGHNSKKIAASSTLWHRPYRTNEEIVLMGKYVYVIWPTVPVEGSFVHVLIWDVPWAWQVEAAQLLRIQSSLFPSYTEWAKGFLDCDSCQLWVSLPVASPTRNQILAYEQLVSTMQTMLVCHSCIVYGIYCEILARRDIWLSFHTACDYYMHCSFIYIYPFSGLPHLN